MGQESRARTVSRALMGPTASKARMGPTVRLAKLDLWARLGIRGRKETWAQWEIRVRRVQMVLLARWDQAVKQVKPVSSSSKSQPTA